MEYLDAKKKKAGEYNSVHSIYYQIENKKLVLASNKSMKDAMAQIEKRPLTYNVDALFFTESGIQPTHDRKETKQHVQTHPNGTVVMVNFTRRPGFCNVLYKIVNHKPKKIEDTKEIKNIMSMVNVDVKNEMYDLANTKMWVFFNGHRDFLTQNTSKLETYKQILKEYQFQYVTRLNECTRGDFSKTLGNLYKAPKTEAAPTHSKPNAPAAVVKHEMHENKIIDEIMKLLKDLRKENNEVMQETKQKGKGKRKSRKNKKGEKAHAKDASKAGDGSCEVSQPNATSIPLKMNSLFMNSYY